MFAIGNEELKKLKSAGETAKCPKCNKMHKIVWGKENNVETKSIGAVKCKGKSYLVAVDGKAIS
jgi:uncharacterized metal-binding protein (TIGR02443 family)